MTASTTELVGCCSYFKKRKNLLSRNAIIGVMQSAAVVDKLLGLAMARSAALLLRCLLESTVLNCAASGYANVPLRGCFSIQTTSCIVLLKQSQIKVSEFSVQRERLHLGSSVL